MNIKQAKNQITNTLRAYLRKDDSGCYTISSVRQRPIFLVGPPGIGKTQIMEQIAAEENVGLVSYTMTHHTRQSAVGLPYIEKHSYNGEEFSVTEYTMSEIIGSVYSLMEKTGIKEGILFLDEINCVSETLAPMMLQFLQCKTFGNRKLPEGWIIVAAGNPPEYNKSVRDFDVVTLDRLKVIKVEESFAVWKEYAIKRGLHGAVVSYLDIKKESFYHIESTADGINYATARGWEDLSELIFAYEDIGIGVDLEVIEQYICVPRIARDFANYLQLYYKYNKTYHIDEILTGAWPRVTELEFKSAPFDEKYAVMNLLLSRLSENSYRTYSQDELCANLQDELRKAMAGELVLELKNAAEEKRKEIKISSLSGHFDKHQRSLLMKEINLLEDYSEKLKNIAPDDQRKKLKEMFGKQNDYVNQMVDETATYFNNAFRFLETAIGQSQELVLFVTDLTASNTCTWFISQFGCDAYYRHNKELLINDTRTRLTEKIIKNEE